MTWDLIQYKVRDIRSIIIALELARSEASAVFAIRHEVFSISTCLRADRFLHAMLDNRPAIFAVYFVGICNLEYKLIARNC